MDVSKLYNQKATLWKSNGHDGFSETFESPAIVMVRWEENNEVYRDQMLEEKISKASVYTEADVSIGDYFYLGESTETNPTQQTDSYKVNAISKIRAVRKTQEVIKAWL